MRLAQPIKKKLYYLIQADTNNKIIIRNTLNRAFILLFKIPLNTIPIFKRQNLFKIKYYF